MYVAVVEHCINHSLIFTSICSVSLHVLYVILQYQHATV